MRGLPIMISEQGPGGTRSDSTGSRLILNTGGTDRSGTWASGWDEFERAFPDPSGIPPPLAERRRTPGRGCTQMATGADPDCPSTTLFIGGLGCQQHSRLSGREAGTIGTLQTLGLRRRAAWWHIYFAADRHTWQPRRGYWWWLGLTLSAVALDAWLAIAFALSWSGSAASGLPFGLLPCS